MNGADSLVHTLIAGGVEVCFTNPGTSEMHLVAALDKRPEIRCVLGLFEGVVTAGEVDGSIDAGEENALGIDFGADGIGERILLFAAAADAVEDEAGQAIAGAGDVPPVARGVAEIGGVQIGLIRFVIHRADAIEVRGAAGDCVIDKGSGVRVWPPNLVVIGIDGIPGSAAIRAALDDVAAGVGGARPIQRDG